MASVFQLASSNLHHTHTRKTRIVGLMTQKDDDMDVVDEKDVPALRTGSAFFGLSTASSCSSVTAVAWMLHSKITILRLRFVSVGTKCRNDLVSLFLFVWWCRSVLIQCLGSREMESTVPGTEAVRVALTTCKTPWPRATPHSKRINVQKCSWVTISSAAVQTETTGRQGSCLRVSRPEEPIPNGLPLSRFGDNAFH